MYWVLYIPVDIHIFIHHITPWSRYFYSHFTHLEKKLQFRKIEGVFLDAFTGSWHVERRRSGPRVHTCRLHSYLETWLSPLWDCIVSARNPAVKLGMTCSRGVGSYSLRFRCWLPPQRHLMPLVLVLLLSWFLQQLILSFISPHGNVCIFLRPSESFLAWKIF